MPTVLVHLPLLQRGHTTSQSLPFLPSSPLANEVTGLRNHLVISLEWTLNSFVFSSPVSPASSSSGAAFEIKFLQFNTEQSPSWQVTSHKQVWNDQSWHLTNTMKQMPSFLTFLSPFAGQLSFNDARSPPKKVKVNLTFQTVFCKLITVPVDDGNWWGAFVYFTFILETKRERLV